MRRPWIKIETATPDKPEICSISTALRMDSDMVLGKLVRLWAWVEVNRIPANNLGVTKEFLDKLVGRKGFAGALVACGWLVEEGGRLSLRNLQRHNGGSAKVRALTAQRVALHRQKKQIAELSSVSEALPAGGEKVNARRKPKAEHGLRRDDHAAGQEEAVHATRQESAMESEDRPPFEEAPEVHTSENNLSAEPPPREPSMEEPAVEESAMEVPVVEEPAMEEPAVEEPAMEEPAMEEPAMEEPVVEVEKQSPGKRRRTVEDPDQPMLF